MERTFTNNLIDELTFTNNLIDTEKNKVKDKLKQLIFPLTAIGTPQALAQVEDTLAFISLDISLGSLIDRLEVATRFLVDNKISSKSTDTVINIKTPDVNASLHHTTKTVFLWHEESGDPVELPLDELYKITKQLEQAQFNWELNTTSQQ